MLPSKRTEITTDMAVHPIVVYGPPKIGKSTFVSEAGDILFVDTENGLASLEVYKVLTPDWKTFLLTCKAYAEEKHQFRFMAIDTIDKLHRMCVDHVMTVNDIAHPSDLKWGKGWDLVKTEFLRPLIKINAMGKGLVMVSHSKNIEVETRTKNITKTVPTLLPSMWEQVASFASIILFMDSFVTENGEKRVIRTVPSENWIAGDRTKRLLRYKAISIEEGRNNWEYVEELFARPLGKEAEQEETKEKEKG